MTQKGAYTTETGWIDNLSFINDSVPVQLTVEEYFDTAYDDIGQSYEDGKLLYTTICIKNDADADNINILVPVDPSNNIDDMFKMGAVYTSAVRDKDNPELHIVSIGEETERRIRIKYWKPLSLVADDFD